MPFFSQGEVDFYLTVDRSELTRKITLHTVGSEDDEEKIRG